MVKNHIIKIGKIRIEVEKKEYDDFQFIKTTFKRSGYSILIEMMVDFLQKHKKDVSFELLERQREQKFKFLVEKRRIYQNERYQLMNCIRVLQREIESLYTLEKISNKKIDITSKLKNIIKKYLEIWDCCNIESKNDSTEERDILKGFLQQKRLDHTNIIMIRDQYNRERGLFR